MCKAELDRFVADVKTNKDLREAAVKEAPGGLHTVAAVARSHGYDFTTEEVQQHIKDQYQELSERELGEVSGGANTAVAAGSQATNGIIIQQVQEASAGNIVILVRSTGRIIGGGMRAFVRF